jgi:RNA polymerase sigma-70 factor (ECF subfamily)
MGVEQSEPGPRQGPEAPSDDAVQEPDRARTGLVERLFREHNEALLRFLFARLRSQQAAREVAQEAYVRLLSLDRPGAVSYLRAYLFKTAANLAVDRLRADETQSQAAQLPFFLDRQEERTPEREVAGAQTLQRLQRLIAALPFKCRKAFILNRFDGKDFATIAHEMHLSERMVRTYVVRGLLRCRAGLDLEQKESKDA